jgi:hypothetical protein
LPTGDGFAAAGAQNQFRSIWASAGGSFAGLSGQFDGVQRFAYWTSTEFEQVLGRVWTFSGSNGEPDFAGMDISFFAVAVRPGDIAAVPEPQTYALTLMGVGALLLAKRRRRL